MAEIAAIAAAVRKAQGAALVEKSTRIGATTTSPAEVEASGGGGEAPDQAQRDAREGINGGNGDDAVGDNGNRSTHAKLDRLGIDVWWGGQDGMVPRNGQGESSFVRAFNFQ